MNYSTIKKIVAFSLVGITGLSTVVAQDASSSSAKVFGGRGQYRTWSLGINAGVLAPVVRVGGNNDFRYWDPNLAYGLTLRKQLGHAFGIEGSFLRGTLSGDNTSGEATGEKAVDAFYIASTDRLSFNTQLSSSAQLSGVVNVATVDFLKRENAVNFIVKAGIGHAWYAPSFVLANNTKVDWKGKAGGGSTNNHKTDTYVDQQQVSAGIGAKFKVSERVNFDLSYTMYFVDGDNLDGTYGKAPSLDKYSYTGAGLEFSLGSTSKPNLDWVNPLAMMYDELSDPTLRQELDALKGRVTTLENTVNQLSADADGDGVSNRFDKCPNTPAGTAVDGSGCPIVHPAFPVQTAAVSTSYPNIQFDFDSSVLKTSSYPTMDRLAADLKAASGSVTLDGHASSEGTDSYNMNLSQDRANSVKTYLVNAGIDANRINTTAYGESRPLASNATEEGRVTNRRVEVKK